MTLQRKWHNHCVQSTFVFNIHYMQLLLLPFTQLQTKLVGSGQAIKLPVVRGGWSWNIYLFVFLPKVGYIFILFFISKYFLIMGRRNPITDKKKETSMDGRQRPKKSSRHQWGRGTESCDQPIHITGVKLFISFSGEGSEQS
jgi:hypothetical protein